MVDLETAELQSSVNRAPGKPPPKRWLTGQNGLGIVLACVLAALVLPPIAYVIYGSFQAAGSGLSGPLSVDAYRKVFGSRTTVIQIRNTLIFAGGSAIFSVAIAGTLAFITQRTDIWGRRVIFIVVVSAMGIPAIVQTMGWSLLLGPNGGIVNSLLTSAFGKSAIQIGTYPMWVNIWTQGFIVAPPLYLLLLPSFGATDPALEEAATMCGASRLRVGIRITGALAAPSILAALLLSFVFSVEAFEVPALMALPGGSPTLSTQLFLSTQASVPDYASAAVIATVMLLIVAVLMIGYQRATRHSARYATVGGKRQAPKPMALGRSRPFMAVAAWMLTFLIVVPVIATLWTSLIPGLERPTLGSLRHLTLSNYRSTWSSHTVLTAVKNSIEIGVVTGVVVMALSVCAGWYVVNAKSRLRHLVDQLGGLPLVVPAIVLSLAVLRTYIRSPIPIYGTFAILAVAFIVHYLPFGIRFASGGLISINSELEEAATMSGAGALYRFRRIVIPLIRPSIIAGFMFVLLAGLQQLPLALFLSGADNQVAPVAMFNLWEYGSYGEVSAFAIGIVLLVGLLAGVSFRMVGPAISQTGLEAKPLDVSDRAGAK